MKALAPNYWLTRLAKPVVARATPRTRLFVRDHLRKWCIDRELPVTTRRGFKMNVSPRDYASYGVYFFGDYDPRMSQAILQFLEPGQTCWDLGTERGWFTLLMAQRVGAAGRVDSFEALPINAERLWANIELNGYGWTNVQATAVSDKIGTVIFEPPDDAVTGHDARFDHCGGVGYVTNQANERTIEVPTTTLDAYAESQGIDELHLIKMDIEGAEVAALRGGADTLRRLRPIIAIEYNRSTLRRAGTSMAELDDTLDALGYDRLFCAADGSFRPVNLAECEGKSDLHAVFNVYAFHRDDPRRPAIGVPFQSRKAA